MTPYALALLLHSALRWAVLAFGVATLVVAWAAWRRGQPLTRGSDQLARTFGLVLDLQVLLGIALWAWWSPFAASARADFAAAMGDSVLRFWLVEHLIGMTVAYLGARLGRWRQRSSGRALPLVIGLLVWLLFVVATIPWPFLPYGRPLLRLLG